MPMFFGGGSLYLTIFAVVNSKTGWVKIHRSILEWEWYGDLPARTLFLHLILTANHSPRRVRGKSIERGQTWTSVKLLSSETGLSTRQVRTAIEKLEKTGELTSNKANDGSLLTVCKYDSYQSFDTTERQTEGQSTDKPPTSHRQATDKPPTTNNNEKNEIPLRIEEGSGEKKEKKSAIPLPPTLEDVLAYFKENGYSSVGAKKAFDYYQCSVTETKKHWSDGKGNPIRNWKMKMQSVWFKDEHKVVAKEDAPRFTYSNPIL